MQIPTGWMKILPSAMQRCKFSEGSPGNSGCLDRHDLVTGSPQDFRSEIDATRPAVYGLTAASFAEISAVCAVVPQLGASLPSPHARGR
jgi:shikimate kinase